MDFPLLPMQQRGNISARGCGGVISDLLRSGHSHRHPRPVGLGLLLLRGELRDADDKQLGMVGAPGRQQQQFHREAQHRQVLALRRYPEQAGEV